MKRSTTFIGALLLTCGLVFGSASVSLAAPGSANIDAATKKLHTMEEQMATAQKSYQSSEARLARARTEAAASREEIKELNARIDTTRQALNVQVNYMYRAGTTSFLEVMLSSKSFDEVSSKITMLGQVSDSNAQVLNDLRKDLRQKAAAQAALDRQLKDQETQTTTLKKLSDQATRDLAAQQGYVDSLSAQQAAALEAAQKAANARAAASSKPGNSDNPSGGGDYTGTGQTFSGLATWYGVGSGTASGERFDPNAMTAAHKTLPFGTLVRVTYQGRSVVVRINDRGPYGEGRVIDLTRAAAEVIGLRSAGVGQVTCEIVN